MIYISFFKRYRSKALTILLIKICVDKADAKLTIKEMKHDFCYNLAEFSSTFHQCWVRQITNV